MKTKPTFVLLILALLLTACGASPTPAESTPDVAAIRTSAAGTVVSQFTLTAAAFTNTPSSAPATEAPATEVATQAPAVTNTATTQPVAQVTNAEGTTVALCDSLTFVADVNVPDGTN